MRPSATTIALPMAALAVVAAGLWATHPTRRADAPGVPLETARPLAALDQASSPWNMSAPIPVAIKVAPPSPAPRDPAPAPDWSQLVIGVAPAAAATTPARVLAPADAPAELAIAMSAPERRALIASARDPELLPPPDGYRPGIAVIVPGGARTDGVCR